MKLRNYYATVSSSFLLLFYSFVLTACPSLEAARSSSKRIKIQEKTFKNETPLETVNQDRFPQPIPSDAGIGRLKERVVQKDVGGQEDETIEDCGIGEMLFEGKCLPKETVNRILEEREQKALAKLKMAKEAPQQAKAVQELLEQQVVQVSKNEDDLDEIIEMLKEENKQLDKQKKKGKI